MARPFAVMPDLPRRFLGGELPRIELSARGAGLGKLDSFVELFWYLCQLHRIGHSGRPDPDLGIWSTLALGLWSNGWDAFRRRRV